MNIESILNMVATEAAEARAEYEIRKRNAEERDMSNSEFFDHLLAVYRNRAEASVLCLLTYKSQHTTENWNQLMEARKREYVAMTHLKTFALEGR